MCSRLGGLSNVDPGIWQDLRELPKPNQLRILLSPELFRLVLPNTRLGDEELERLRRFLGMERYLDDSSKGTLPGSWTALGDYYSGDGEPRWQDPWASEYAECRRFASPRVGSVVIDTDSPHHEVVLPQEFGKIERHPASEHELITHRIEEALEHMRRVSQVAASTVREAVQVITVAKTPDDLERTGSSSWRCKPGMVGLINLHNDNWSTARLCNALVHEAIHSTIYKIELEEALFQDPVTASKERATSPWSGRNLAVTSFAHACFVWYGLWNFWAQDLSGDAEAIHFREKAHHGFLCGPLLSHLSPAGHDSISENGRQAIIDIYARVQEAGTIAIAS